MKPVLILLMAAAAGNVAAQTLPSADVDTVRSGIGEESLAPLPMKAAVPAVASPAVLPASGAVSASEVVSPFVVKNVVVTLSGTTGFDRDAALEQGARQALPGVLTAMGIEAEEAAKTVKSLGSVMTFVKSYKVVKETLIPTYTLTSDLTFNDAMLKKNFGGKGVQPKVEAPTGTPTAAADEVPVADGKPVNQWVVKIDERDPAVVDRVRLNLSKQPGTRAAYRLLTSGGAELVVDTPLNAADITRLAGHPVQVIELEIPLPSGMVQTGQGDPRAWQGQEQPSAPNAPAAPSAPEAPADPNGGSY